MTRKADQSISFGDMGFDGIDRNRKFVGDPGVFFFFFFFDSTQHENFQTLGR